MNEAGVDMNNYTNSELEEMGVPLPCPCLSTYREYDEQDNLYDVCVDCGCSAPAPRTHRRWFSWW